MSHKVGSESPKPTHHYGRGGAGNVTSMKHPSPVLQPESTPTLTSNVYTTGRGGTGNMAKNDSPEEARAAQDVDVPGITLPEGQHHTGRGGAANIYTPSQEESQEAKQHNEKVRQESFSRRRSQDHGLKGLADKGKDLFKGKKSD